MFEHRANLEKFIWLNALPYAIHFWNVRQQTMKHGSSRVTSRRKRWWSKRDESKDSSKRGYVVNLMELQGIVFFQLFPRNETINSSVYYRQLDELNNAIRKIRPELVNRKRVVFRRDNARPHTSLETRREIVAARIWDIFTKSCTIRLSLVLFSSEFFKKKIRWFLISFSPQKPGPFWARNSTAARKMTKSNEYVIKWIKLLFDI